MLNVTILTDWYPHKTSWEVLDASTGQKFATNAYALESETYTPLAKCIPQKDYYQFTFHGSYGASGTDWVLECDGDSIMITMS